jgi:hypothetical protein
VARVSQCTDSDGNESGGLEEGLDNGTMLFSRKDANGSDSVGATHRQAQPAAKNQTVEMTS